MGGRSADQGRYRSGTTRPAETVTVEPWLSARRVLVLSMFAEVRQALEHDHDAAFDAGGLPAGRRVAIN